MRSRSTSVLLRVSGQWMRKSVEHWRAFLGMGLAGALALVGMLRLGVPDETTGVGAAVNSYGLPADKFSPSLFTRGVLPSAAINADQSKSVVPAVSVHLNSAAPSASPAGPLRVGSRKSPKHGDWPRKSGRKRSQTTSRSVRTWRPCLRKLPAKGQGTKSAECFMRPLLGIEIV